MPGSHSEKRVGTFKAKARERDRRGGISQNQRIGGQTGQGHLAKSGGVPSGRLNQGG